MQRYDIFSLLAVFTLSTARVARSDRGGRPSAAGFHCPAVDKCPECLTCADSTCTVHPNYCYIENKCVRAGASNLGDNHQICRPLKSELDWTEEYEFMSTQGIIVQMTLEDKAKWEHLAIVACDVLSRNLLNYCRLEKQSCMSQICPLIGVDQPTFELERPLNIQLKKCWIEPFFEAPKDTKWQIYAKMELSRYDLDEMCYGYPQNTGENKQFWLLPNCIMEGTIQRFNIIDLWNEKLGTSLRMVRGFCNPEVMTPGSARSGPEGQEAVADAGGQISVLYWVLIGLAGLAVVLMVIIALVCVQRKKRNEENQRSQAPPSYSLSENQGFDTNTYVSPVDVSRPGLGTYPSPGHIPPAYPGRPGGSGGGQAGAGDREEGWVSQLDGIPLKH